MSIGNGSLGGLLGEFHCIEHCKYSVVVIWSLNSDDGSELELLIVPDLAVHSVRSVMDENAWRTGTEHSPAVHTVTIQEQTLRVELPP